MGKVLVFLLGFGILLAAGYHFLYGSSSRASIGLKPAPGQLERVRKSARQIEAQGQERAEKAAGELAGSAAE